MQSMRSLVSFALVATALATFSAVPLASAGEPTDQLRTHVDEVLKVLQDPKLATPAKADERRAQITKLASQIFDFQATAQRALGRYWRDRTPAEREEFVKLFTDVLADAYLTRIDQYHGEKVTYGAETVEGDHATVRTRIVTPKGTDLPVDYRMMREDGRWRVYDVVIEGISLVSNYRTQFNKIIQTASYQELVNKLKARAFAAPGTETGRKKS